MKRLLSFWLLMLPLLVCRAQIPAFTNRLVNDFADVLTNDEERSMETRLRNYFDSTSNCIIVVTINELQGYEASDFAQRLGEKWGVGTGKYNNGLVILLSPKHHEIFIATGYGLEGVLPDVVCHRIAEKEMKPHFKEENYYKGLVAGLDVILPVAAKEYSYEQYEKEKNAEDTKSALTVMGVLALLILSGAIVFRSRKKRATKRTFAIQAIKNARSRAGLNFALQNASRLRVKDVEIQKALQELRVLRVKDVEKARTYQALVDSMSIAKDVGVSEEEVQKAKLQGVISIIGSMGEARSIAEFQSATREAELVGATSAEVVSYRQKAKEGILEDIATATTLNEFQTLVANATPFEVTMDELKNAKASAGQNALYNISYPKSISQLKEAIAIAEAVGVPESQITAAKQMGQNYAMVNIDKAETESEILTAGNLALYLGAAALAVETARKLAQARLRQSMYSSGDYSSDDRHYSSRGGSYSSGRSSSSGSFGGFGGGHFGGGGGGAKW